MKHFHSLALAILVCIAAGLSSCSSGRYFQFAPNSTGYRTVPGPKPAAKAEPVEPEVPVLTASAAAAPEAPVRTVIPVAPVAAPPAVAAPSPKLSEQVAAAKAEHKLTKSQERRYNKILDRVKHAEQSQAAKGANIVEVILCIIPFLAALGVYLHEGATVRVWIALLLSFLFILPGIIFGLLVVTDTI